MDEAKNWKRQGIEYDKEDLRTELLPKNIAPEEVIRRVLLCNPPGLNGFTAPISELLLAWRITCPDEDFESIVDKAGHVCTALQVAANKKAQPKKENEIDG